MRTIKHTFEEVSDRKTVYVKCSQCDKKVARTLVASQTINPWNNKTHSQIHKENVENISKQQEQLENSEIVCGQCLHKHKPDIGTEILTPEEFNKAGALIGELGSLYTKCEDIRRQMDNMYCGKYVKLMYNKTARIGKITSVYMYYGEIYISGRIVRKDQKGLTDYDFQIKNPCPQDFLESEG